MVVFAPGETGPGDGTVVPMPDWDSEAGLWACFSAICGAVGEGERLIVDLTHAPGPLPFVVFLALPYLREPEGGDDRAGLLRRASRARSHRAARPRPDPVRRGPRLGRRRRRPAPAPRRERAHGAPGRVQDRAHREQREPPPLHLKPFANNLARFASAARLARPNEAFLAAHLLLARLDGVEGEIAADLPVLRPLLDRIGRLAPIADDEPALDGTLLRRQLIFMRYQLDHGLVLQAVELGREWLVNLLLLRLGCEPGRWLDRDLRHAVSRTATGAVLARQHADYEPTPLSERFAALPDAEGFVSLWQAIGDLRNDLAHCGMNEQPKSVRVIERRAAAVIAALEALA